MRFNFDIRKDRMSKIGIAPIRLVVKHEKIRISKNIDVKAGIDNWDNETETIVYSKGHPYAKEYRDWNKTIFETKDKVEKIFEFFKYNNFEFSEKQFLNALSQIIDL
ncbi:hypothetical protein [Sphingobacterium sp. NPDC055431]